MTVFRINYFFIFLLFLFSIKTISAQQKDFSAIDKFARKAPPGISKLYKPLTHYLTDRYSSEEDKVRSISVWIVNNIKYDAKMYSTDKRKKLKPNKILRKRKAICQGYCDLFDAMCTEAGIMSATITGYDKGASYEPQDIFVRDDHAWSAVNTDGGWHLIDLTWASGYIIPKRQAFRRLLYFTLKIPFRQKYKFVRQLNYDYYYADPDKFAQDHLPVYPWWQMTPVEKSIDAFEKDTIPLKDPRAYTNTAGASVSIPDFENSTEPVAYLKKAKAAFKFNPKNYRALAEGKTLYAYHWFIETNKSKSIENKTKVETYDSCKTIVDEAKDAEKEYIQYTSKERAVRVLKNKAYHKASADFNKEQKNKIRKETQLNFKYIDQLDKQISFLKKERSQLRRENNRISSEKLPEKKKMAVPPDPKPYREKIHSLTDSILAEQNNITAFFQQNKPVLMDSLGANEIAVDSLINHTEGIMSYKMLYRFFFNWNFKIAVDTLQYQHADVSVIKDSVFSRHGSALTDVALFAAIVSGLSSKTREHYNQRLGTAEQFYAYCGDSSGQSAKDSCKSAENDWNNFNDRRMSQINELIIDLKSQKRVIRSQNRKLRGEQRYNNSEIKFERFRYKVYNLHYSTVCNHEKKKAVTYLKALSALKKQIQVTESKCKEELKKEEKKEREELRQAAAKTE